MNYISVKEAANFLSLKELCEELSISTATGRNWIKLGKLLPEYTQRKTPYFSKKYVKNVKAELYSGKNAALKSRRNKKYISGNALYNSYVSEQCQNIPVLQKLLSLISDNEIELTHSTIQLLIADCALHLFANKQKLFRKNNTNLLLRFLNHEFFIEEYDELINHLIDNTDSAIDFCNAHPQLFNLKYIYEPNEDILGLIYISCKSMANRKATGSYYTPTKVVKNLIHKLDFRNNDRILDPCCGTGNFLLQLPDNTLFNSIYGNDIDPISVKITRLNMALKFNVPVSIIHAHITNVNYLTEYSNGKFHHIIGNPPWGYEFSNNEKNILKNSFKSTSGKNIESYDIFIEQALNHLEIGGHLAFVLPEAFLNVKAHTDIRKIILQSCSIKNIDYLGNAFDGVQCPCIILDLQNTHSHLSTIGMTVNTGTQKYTINTERNVSAEHFSFTTTDEEYTILTKLKSLNNAKFLFGNAEFALGIVTGDNKKYISREKTDSNEMILKGADICKYHINSTNNYIVFKPEIFQQVAPIEIYRAPEKLLYRFISNQLVFAYDNKQTLSLNSCNIVIPKIDGLNIKYILAILNSRVAQFIYKKEFNSVKVLRSHIENIPIPLADVDMQTSIIQITDLLINGLDYDKAQVAYDKLDILVGNLFNLTNSEMEIIQKSISSENIFGV